jgi:hypothetical protein
MVLPTVSYEMKPMLSYGITKSRYLPNHYDKSPIFSVYAQTKDTLQSIQQYNKKYGARPSYI